MFRSDEAFMFNVWAQGLESALDAFLGKLKSTQRFMINVEPSSISVVISYLLDRTDSALSRQSLM